MFAFAIDSIFARRRKTPPLGCGPQPSPRSRVRMRRTMFGERKMIVMLVAFPAFGAGICAASSCGRVTSNEVPSQPDVGAEHDATAGNTDTPATETGAGVDSVADDRPTDATSGEDACACKPDYCGCGACAVSDIVCTKTPPSCPRGPPPGCAGSCPELTTTTCSCESDRCVRSGASGPVACYTDLDCPPGECCSHVGPPVPPIGRGTCKPAGDPCCGVGCT